LSWAKVVVAEDARENVPGIRAWSREEELVDGDLYTGWTDLIQHYAGIDFSFLALLQSEWMILDGSGSDLREHTGQNLEARVLEPPSPG
jgi:hypothetical protein